MILDLRPDPNFSSAILAADTVGELSPALEIAAEILGGGVAAISHATKTGIRLMINSSPEPVTNWSASISEDLLMLGGLWAALNHPIVFLILFVVFIGLAKHGGAAQYRLGHVVDECLFHFTGYRNLVVAHGVALKISMIFWRTWSKRSPPAGFKQSW